MTGESMGERAGGRNATSRSFVAAAVLNLLALPLTALLALSVLGPWCPPLQGFLADVEIRNGTGETLRVTPVAATERGGERVLPPTCEGHWPARWTAPHREGEIAPGGTLRMTYSVDDCYLAEVVVRRASGEMRQVTVTDVGRNPISGYRPEHAPVTIEGLDRLPVPEAYVTAPLERTAGRGWELPGLGLLALGPLVHLGTGAAAVVALRRRRRAESK